MQNLLTLCAFLFLAFPVESPISIPGNTWDPGETKTITVTGTPGAAMTLEVSNREGETYTIEGTVPEDGEATFLVTPWEGWDTIWLSIEDGSADDNTRAITQ